MCTTAPAGWLHLQLPQPCPAARWSGPVPSPVRLDSQTKLRPCLQGALQFDPGDILAYGTLMRHSCMTQARCKSTQGATASLHCAGPVCPPLAQAARRLPLKPGQALLLASLQARASDHEVRLWWRTGSVLRASCERAAHTGKHTRTHARQWAAVGPLVRGKHSGTGATPTHRLALYRSVASSSPRSVVCRLAAAAPLPPPPPDPPPARSPRCG